MVSVPIEPAPIKTVKTVPVFENRFGTLFNDETEGPTGDRGRYLRWTWAHQGVVVVPVHEGRVGLWSMYRYPIGAASLEFPRGGADNGEDLEQAALRELHEETGLVATRSKALGRLHPESGLLSASVVVVRADITGGLDSAGRIEPMESVAVSPLWLTSGEFVRLLTDGLLTCGITIAAWALWRSVDS